MLQGQLFAIVPLVLQALLGVEDSLVVFNVASSAFPGRVSPAQTIDPQLVRVMDRLLVVDHKLRQSHPWTTLELVAQRAVPGFDVVVRSGP